MNVYLCICLCTVIFSGMRSGRTTRSNWRDWPQETPVLTPVRRRTWWGRRRPAPPSPSTVRTHKHTLSLISRCLTNCCDPAATHLSSEVTNTLCGREIVSVLWPAYSQLLVFRQTSSALTACQVALSDWMLHHFEYSLPFFLSCWKIFFFFCVLWVKQDFFCHFSEASFPPHLKWFVVFDNTLLWKWHLWYLHLS